MNCGGSGSLLIRDDVMTHSDIQLRYIHHSTQDNTVTNKNTTMTQTLAIMILFNHSVIILFTMKKKPFRLPGSH